LPDLKKRLKQKYGKNITTYHPVSCKNEYRKVHNGTEKIDVFFVGKEGIVYNFVS